MQVGHVERGEARADLRGDQPAGSGAGHAQAQVAEGDDVLEPGVADDVVAGVDRPRRGELGESLAVGEPGLAREVLAEEEGAEPPRKIGEAGAVVVRAFEPARVGEGRRLVLKAKQLRHVVIRGVARRLHGHAVERARFLAAQAGQPDEEGGHVVEEIRRHHRRRHGRVADHLAGEHEGVGAAEDAVDGVEVVQRVDDFLAGCRLPVHAQALVAVDQVVERLVAVFGQLQELQVAEVAVGGLALEAEAFPRLGGEEMAQAFALLRGQGMQQFVLLVEPEVDDLEAFLPVFRDERLVAADVGLVAAVLADDDLDPVPHAGGPAAVVVQRADLVDAFEAGLEVGRAIRHRDREDEAMAVVVAAPPDQRLLFAEQRLVACQQRVKLRFAGPHGLFQQGVAVFVEFDEGVERRCSLAHLWERAGSGRG